MHIQFFRYFFVGGSAAVVDLAIYAFCLQVLGVHYALSALIAYLIALAWNHAICLFWVFESRHNRALEVLLVLLIALGGLLWTELLLYLQIEWFHFGAVLAKIIALWIVLLWNFFMRKFLVFR
jgi:putative flippase GtrA